MCINKLLCLPFVAGFTALPTTRTSISLPPNFGTWTFCTPWLVPLNVLSPPQHFCLFNHFCVTVACEQACGLYLLYLQCTHRRSLLPFQRNMRWENMHADWFLLGSTVFPHISCTGLTTLTHPLAHFAPSLWPLWTSPMPASSFRHAGTPQPHLPPHLLTMYVPDHCPLRDYCRCCL